MAAIPGADWEPAPGPVTTSAHAAAPASAPPWEDEPWPGRGRRRRRFGKRLPGAAFTDAWLVKPVFLTAPSTFLMKTPEVKDHITGLLYPA